MYREGINIDSLTVANIDTIAKASSIALYQYETPFTPYRVPCERPNFSTVAK